MAPPVKGTCLLCLCIFSDRGRYQLSPCTRFTYLSDVYFSDRCQLFVHTVFDSFHCLFLPSTLSSLISLLVFHHSHQCESYGTPVSLHICSFTLYPQPTHPAQTCAHSPVKVPIPRAPSLIRAGDAVIHFIRIGEHIARIFRVVDAICIYFK